MERSQSAGKLSAMAKAKTAFQSLHQKAEKLLNEVKSELRGHEGSSNSLISPSSTSKASSSQHLPWSAKNTHEKKHEADFKRRILEIAEKPEEYFLGPCDETLLIDMRAAMVSAGAILEVDEPLRNLRYQLVPKKMSDQEFWKRYTIAVKRIKQEVLDATAGEEAAEESSLTDSVIISRQESGLEALREAAKRDLQETPVFLPLPIPPSTTVRRLSRAVEFSRACSSMKELSAYEGEGPEQGGDGSDTWSNLVSGLPGFTAKARSKSKTSSAGGAAEYHALLWTLFEADANAEDLASSSEAGVLDRPHTFAEDIQGAPADSFVAQLAEVMAGIKSEQKMAAFWLEVVKQLRKHWVERRPVPRTPIDAQPELYFCNLQQQVELLNCCIARWKRRVAAVEAAKAAATAAAAEAAALLPSRELETRPVPAERSAPDEAASRPTPTTNGPTPEEGRSLQEPPIESTSEIRNQSPGNGDKRSQSGASTGRVAESGAGGENGGGELGHSSPPQVQKRAAREGVDCAVVGMRLLSTGEQMYAPVTQEGPILTEDLIKETEELVLKTGSVGHGCKQLLSDMQAFKAANPGCILEDFVRWYSPPDFIQGATPTPPSKSRPHSRGRPETLPQPEGGPRTEDSPATPSTRTATDASEPCPSPFTPPRLFARTHFQKGVLSARMQSEGNLWQELWASALPVPAIRQAPLFDEELAGETALDELASIAPSDLFEQLYIVALGAGFAVAQSAPQAAQEPLKSCLEKCASYAVETCGRQMSPSKLERLCQVYETMEHVALLPPDEDQPSSTSSEGGNKEGEEKRNGGSADENQVVASSDTARAEDPNHCQLKKVDSEVAPAAVSNGVTRSARDSEDGWTVL